MSIIQTKPCPKCGKPMTEQVKFPGLWACPDYSEPLNDAPPFRYRCEGITLTEAGAVAFEAELLRVYLKRERN